MANRFDGRSKKKKGQEYTVPKEMQCGITKADGQICRGPKKKGFDYCPRHNPENMALLAEARTKSQEAILEARNIIQTPIESLDDIIKVSEWALRQMLDQKLSVGETNCVGFILDKTTKAMIAKQKMDPKAIAQRTLSREAAANAARGLSLADARQVAANRNFKLLEDQSMKQPVIKVLTPEEAMKKLNLVKPPAVAIEDRESTEVNNLDVVEVDQIDGDVTEI